MKLVFLLMLVALFNCVLPPRDVYSAEIHNLMADHSSIHVRVIRRCVDETQPLTTFSVKLFFFRLLFGNFLMLKIKCLMQSYTFKKEGRRLLYWIELYCLLLVYRFNESMKMKRMVLKDKNGTKFVCPIQEIVIGKLRQPANESSTTTAKDDVSKESEIHLKAPFNVTVPTDVYKHKFA